VGRGFRRARCGFPHELSRPLDGGLWSWSCGTVAGGVWTEGRPRWRTEGRAGARSSATRHLLSPSCRPLPGKSQRPDCTQYGLPVCRYSRMLRGESFRSSEVEIEGEMRCVLPTHVRFHTDPHQSSCPRPARSMYLLKVWSASCCFTFLRSKQRCPRC
jgi:hypothetical protein